nr:translation initiation factor IF-2 associated domain-containing protein [Brucella abortus]
MSDKTNDDKTLSVNPKKTLTLKRPGVEQSTVRQNFSHGRTKAVVVETKKRKFSRPDEKPEVEAAAAPSPQLRLLLRSRHRHRRQYRRRPHRLPPRSRHP